MTAATTIAPIIKTIRVRATVKRAFDAFSREISTWWPIRQHSLDSDNTEAVILEARAGGRLYQRQKDGTEHEWGHVTVFQRPDRLTLAWHIGRPAEQATRVDVTFTDIGAGLTEVVLVHDGFEVMDDGATMRDGYDNGWVNVFEVVFANALGGVVSEAAE